MGRSTEFSLANDIRSTRTNAKVGHDLKQGPVGVWFNTPFLQRLGDDLLCSHERRDRHSLAVVEIANADL